MRALALAALLAGCSPALDEPTRIVWREAFGATCWPPGVEFLRGSECGGHQAFLAGGQCVSGIFWPDRWQAEVEEDGLLSDSAFAHELLHAWQACRGVYDVDHLSPEWQVLIPLANDELRASGY